jgi:hypothetical protein
MIRGSIVRSQILSRSSIGRREKDLKAGSGAVGVSLIGS